MHSCDLFTHPLERLFCRFFLFAGKPKKEPPFVGAPKHTDPQSVSILSQLMESHCTRQIGHEIPVAPLMALNGRPVFGVGGFEGNPKGTTPSFGGPRF